MTPRIPIDIWLEFARWAPEANPHKPLSSDNKSYDDWYLGALQGLTGLGETEFGIEGQRGFRAVKQWLRQVTKPAVKIPSNAPRAEEFLALGCHGFGESDSAVAVLASVAKHDSDCLPVG